METVLEKRCVEANVGYIPLEVNESAIQRSRRRTMINRNILKKLKLKQTTAIDKVTSTTLNSTETIDLEQQHTIPLSLAHPTVGSSVYARTSLAVNQSWEEGKVKLEVCYKRKNFQNFQKFKICIENKKIQISDVRHMARFYPPPEPMSVGTRVIAKFRDDSEYYAAVVAESPQTTNHMRYLIFFDDGFVQYAEKDDIRQVYAQSACVWEDLTDPVNKELIEQYLTNIKMNPTHTKGDEIKVKYEGKLWNAKVKEVDDSLIKVLYDEDSSEEWMYCGSFRVYGPSTYMNHSLDIHQNISEIFSPYQMNDIWKYKHENPEHEIADISEYYSKKFGFQITNSIMIKLLSKDPQHISAMKKKKKTLATSKKSIITLCPICDHRVSEDRFIHHLSTCRPNQDIWKISKKK